MYTTVIIDSLTAQFGATPQPGKPGMGPPPPSFGGGPVGNNPMQNGFQGQGHVMRQVDRS